MRLGKESRESLTRKLQPDKTEKRAAIEDKWEGETKRWRSFDLAKSVGKGPWSKTGNEGRRVSRKWKATAEKKIGKLIRTVGCPVQERGWGVDFSLIQSGAQK